MMFPDCTDTGVSPKMLDPAAGTASGVSGPSFPPPSPPPPGLPDGVLGAPVVLVVPLRFIVRVILVQSCS
jgi:hypothetical protein